MANESPLSFKLPNQQTVEAYLVRLPNGQLVARTRDELEPVQPPVVKPPAPAGK